ncbi:hypothetical protein BX666DRAFT_1857674 [Dichotomocladium elegans]|nr:hypothetical protein BX666DRAFT_1857674 [Dichotomocladium elegans]
MPPKRPLNPLERKVKKKKSELIQKAKIKGRYYKSIKKDNFSEDAPSYVKEIFSERTIDDEGNVVEYNSGKNDNKSTKKNHDNDDREYYLNDTDSDEDGNNKPRKHKPNPFKAQIEERDMKRKLTNEEREERQRQREEAEKAKKKYYKQRGQERGKMLSRTRKGQVKMAVEMDNLLNKIKMLD